MKEQKADQQNLRDKPVPPVKGAVTDLQDICPRPRTQMVKETPDPENWL